MSALQDKPYNDLLYLPPEASLDSVPLLRACIPARTVLADPMTKEALRYWTDLNAIHTIT